MKEYSGRLERLGSSTITTNPIGKTFVTYDSIEIGNTILQKVRTARNLTDYVSDGVGSEVTLYMNGKFLIGVKLASGKVYYWKRSIVAPLFQLIPCAVMGSLVASVTNSGFYGFLGFAVLYFLVAQKDLKQVFSYQPKLLALGGAGLKS